MLKIAISDDNKVVANQIEKLLLDVCGREHIPVDTDVFYDGDSLEREIRKGTRYDLIYLDIQMEGGDGITTAKNIRKIDENVLLIYISGYEEYMMELFRLDVFAFMKKPVKAEDFAGIFLDAHRKICNRRFYFTYHYQNKEYKIPCMDILYFESAGRKIKLHEREGIVKFFNGKLSEVETQLSGGKVPFLRIHQSYLVNYHHVKSRLKTQVTMADGTKLPVSSDRQKSFGEQYGRLLGGEVDV